VYASYVLHAAATMHTEDDIALNRRYCSSSGEINVMGGFLRYIITN